MQLFRQRRFVHILNPLEVHNGFPVSSCCFSLLSKLFSRQFEKWEKQYLTEKTKKILIGNA